MEYEDHEFDKGEEMEESEGDSQQLLKYWVESLEDSTFKNVNIGNVRELLEQIHRNYLSNTDAYLEKLLNTDALVTINKNIDILKTKLSDI